MSDPPWLDAAPICRACVTPYDEPIYLAMPDHPIACSRCGRRAHLAIATEPARMIGGVLRGLFRDLVAFATRPK